MENLPWFGNNAYLQNFLDSIGYPQAGTTARIVTPDRARFHIPIKFWIYRNSAGIGGPRLQDLQIYMDNLNRIYNTDNNTLIGFYMKCNIGFVDDDSHVDVESDNEAMGLIQDHKEAGCINIHIANTIAGGALGVQYRARFFGVDGIFLASRTYSNTDFAATIAHEVGHYLELDHTHQYYNKGKCRQEAIDRGRTWPTFNLCFSRLKSNTICEATGDCLSDTPADPELNANSSCIFNNAGNYTSRADNWGDSYASPPSGSSVPDTRNIMNYNGVRSCRIVFSRQQIAVMLYSLYLGKNTNNLSEWRDIRSEYDDFEMDNFSQTSRPILLGENQEHNFHQQSNRLGIVGFFNQCDVDWVRFVAPCNNNFNITTSSILNRANANTRLTLFNNALTQLSQNDNISSTNLFSNINFNFIAGNEYFIRVENMGSIETTYYNLSIGAIPPSSIVGSGSLCTTANTYTLQNPPPNSTVFWSVSNTSIASLASNGASCTLTKLADGPFTLTATIFNPCYSTQVLTFNIYAGLPYFGASYKDGRIAGNPVAIYFPNQHPYNFNNVCIGYGFPNVYIDAQPYGASNVSWSIPSGYATTAFSLTQQTGNRAYFNWNYGGNTPPGYLQASISNSCGSYSQIFAFQQVNCGTPGGDPCTSAKGEKYYTISPNPASDQIKIGIANKPPPIKCDQLKAISTSNGIIFSAVNLYDNLGTLVKSYKTKDSKSATIEISNLIAGPYLIEIIQGDYIEKQQIIVQK